MIARRYRSWRFTPAIFLAALITVSMVVTFQPVSAARCTNPYKVVSGDSFYRIAIKMGVPESKRADYVAQILWINHNPKVIHPGDELCLPPTSQTPEPRPRREWTRAEVEKIIRNIWPDMSEGIALAVVERESHLNPYSHSGTCCYGLFQIYWEVHKVRASALHRFLGGKGDPGPHILYSPRFNTLLALQMYRQGGWAPWCSSSGFPTAC